jgi:hypothetical protein
MTASTEGRVAGEATPQAGKRKWDAPELTVLGDVDTLTAAGTAVNPDGGGVGNALS